MKYVIYVTFVHLLVRAILREPRGLECVKYVKEQNPGCFHKNWSTFCIINVMRFSMDASCL